MTAVDASRTTVRYRVEADEIDRHNVDAVAADIRNVLSELDAAPEVFVLDCVRVAFIDSSAIAAVIRLQRRLGSMGTRLQIENTAPPVRRSVEVLGLAERLGLR